ncbi:hypothetical protein EI94DRAFT_592133 [Lactarius quietus]|nr:hypothetical protein EI94DRAFT_592133 [Lactarius quietus]
MMQLGARLGVDCAPFVDARTARLTLNTRLSSMATAQDVGHGQMTFNSPGPPASQIAGTGAQIVESQGSPSQLRVEVTVRRAHPLPEIKKQFGPKRRFFVTVANRATIKKTKSVQIDGQAVHWNQRLGAFSPQPSSHFILCLYEKRFLHPDVLIGTLEIPIPVESQTDVPFFLTNEDSRVGQSIRPVTLYLTVVVSPILLINTTDLQLTGVNDLLPREDTSLMAGDSAMTIRTIIPTDSEALSPPVDPLPLEMSTALPPAADRQARLSSAKDALRVATKAMATINLSDAWEGALERIKWVMDILSPVAELSPYAKMAYGLLFAIPKTLLEQFQRDDNVRTLVVAIRDAFDFAKQEDTFKTIERVPRQAQIITLMLQHVCNCCEFIQSYAKDSQYCMSS